MSGADAGFLKGWGSNLLAPIGLHASTGIFLSGGEAEGALPPLNFDNPKRSKIWCVVHGAIIRPIAASAKCESAAIDFWIFFQPFLFFL